MMARSLKQLGLAGIMGSSLLMAAGWAQWHWVPEQQAALDKLASQARHLRHDLQQASPLSDPAEQNVRVRSPEAAWDALWQGLPDAAQRVPLQSAVLSAASKRGVAISGVQYQGARQPWSEREGQVLWRQRMVMPASGSYPAVKAWLAAMLKEPALSIDEVSLQRGDLASDQVQVRVAVSLWWRKPEKAQP
ncbi:MAG: hypothetical protein EPO09_17740 [Aquabacterium sp.]|uniref:hypothetical protein n=1 Tax=Aquabacterium sp. TaxID=1872578 RepID=UPI0011FC42DC|nr:hypothetical protein [Aquabacterium sp.]TAK88739.1 MAG: hypothetical protein EPO09_17740 [Aquabacterium sp.]